MRTKSVLTGLLVIAAGAVCFGQTIDYTIDPLHGYCSVGCVDNGGNSPTTQNPITGFGFTVSPQSQSGDLLIDVLVPNAVPTVTSYAITGTSTATAALVSSTAWTSGQLDSYLGLSASPTNPLGAYDPEGYYSSATGFYVYQADLGQMTLNGPSNPNVNPLLNITALPIGSYIVAFLNQGASGIIATANSGAILETSPGGGGGGGGGGQIPEPSSIVLLGTVLLGMASLSAVNALKKKTQNRF